MKVIDPVKDATDKLWKKKGMPEWSDEEFDKMYAEVKAGLQI